jgi:hypothetical protein
MAPARGGGHTATVAPGAGATLGQRASRARVTCATKCLTSPT